MNREVPIDVVRSFAMLTIAINHMAALLVDMGYSGFQLPTLTSAGFSSSAEIFFALSGYMVGMVYLSRPGLLRICLSRAFRIYLYNFAGFLCVLALWWAFDPTLLRLTGLAYTVAQPLAGVGMFAVFLQHPYLLGVLQLYILLLILTPGASALFRASRFAVPLLSLAAYAAVQFFPWLNLPGGSPAGNWEWNLNPIAWQFLYFSGMALGRSRVHSHVFEWLERSWLHLLAPPAVFALLALPYFAHACGVIHVPQTQKVNLGVVRVLHSSVAICTMASLAILVVRFSPRKVVDHLCAIGGNTLECYTASIVLTYILAALWRPLGADTLSYLIVTALLVAALWMVAVLKSDRSARRSPALGKDLDVKTGVT